MQTIKIANNLYNEALIYANQHNKTISELVEEYIKDLLYTEKKQPYKMKTIEELPKELQEIIGVAYSPNADENDLNGRKEIEEFLLEKNK
ncbi:MAG: hypothetical protein IJ213_06960 [Bacteroidales bacterium]|nr:hypothetical protein [Bacteroidales bacterium]